jgi:hypothetical protein
METPEIPPEQTASPNLYRGYSMTTDERLLNDIAAMMGEFVDNWPNPKKVSTALALIAKTMRSALNPPKHDYWGAGERDCPREIKAGNGELHTMRCKVCGLDNPRDDFCRARTASSTREA